MFWLSIFLFVCHGSIFVLSFSVFPVFSQFFQEETDISTVFPDRFTDLPRCSFAIFRHDLRFCLWCPDFDLLQARVREGMRPCKPRTDRLTRRAAVRGRRKETDISTFLLSPAKCEVSTDKQARLRLYTAEKMEKPPRFCSRRLFWAVYMAACTVLCWHVCIFRVMIGWTIYGKTVNLSFSRKKLRTNLHCGRTDILMRRTHRLTGRIKRRFRSQNLFALFSKSFCPVLLSFLPLLFVPMSCASLAGFKSFCP